MTLNRLTKKIMLALSVCSMALMAMVVVVSYFQQRDSKQADLQEIHKVLNATFDAQAKTEIETALSALQAVADRAKSSQMSLEDAKKLGAQVLRGMKYGKGGYFWADTVAGLNVVLPGNPREGQMRWDDVDSKGFHHVQAFIATGLKGGGYVDYWFPRKGETESLPKRSYTAQFEPFGWVIGTGNYLTDIDAEMQRRDVEAAAAEKSSAYSLTIVGLFGLCVSLVLGFYMGRSISLPLQSAVDELRVETESSFASSQRAGEAARNLEQASDRQTSVVSETMQAIHEISTMIHRTAESATQSIASATSSLTSARAAKQSGAATAESIHEIANSNADILNEVESGHQRIGQIKDVIAGISKKTKVINEIVFQTKLLSFNASVEAARAGEHGKGFAVVAEEVGNLARMSGAAALEINSLLDASDSKVDEILAENRMRIESLIQQGKSKLEAGTANVERGNRGIDQIVNEAEGAQTKIQDISIATEQQSQSATQISESMTEASKLAAQNESLAKTLTEAADVSSAQAKTLERLSQHLVGIIWGGSDSVPASNRVVQMRSALVDKARKSFKRAS